MTGSETLRMALKRPFLVPIVDACQLADTIKVAADGHMSVQDAVKEYERQMRPRAKEAVETSRQAGLDGHCYTKVDQQGSFALLGEKSV